MADATVAVAGKPRKENKSYRLPATLIDDVERMAIDTGEMTCRMVERILADAVKVHNHYKGDGRR